MKPQVRNHSKEYSIAIIRHAISKAAFDGEKQKDVAEFLGVDPTNIPKYKNGEQKLSINNVSRLIEKYGCPKLAPGKYMQAVCYNDINDYLSSFEQRKAAIFAQALANFFKNKNVWNYLAWSISTDVLMTTEEITRPYRMSFKGCSKSDVPSILDWLKNQCEQSEFKQWHSMAKTYEPRKIVGFKDSWLPKLKEGEWFKARLSSGDLILFYLLAYYLENVCSEFPSSDKENNFTSPHITQAEVVITGEEILAFESSELAKKLLLPFPSTNNQTIPLGDNHSYLTNRTFNDEAIEKQIATLNETRHVSSKVTLFMNTEMEYRVVINENWGGQEHIVVIKNVPQDLVINEYVKFSRFFGLEPDKEYELKEKIAMRGGFLAGALLL